MLRNYLIITLRNINKFKGYSAINIIGLALGVAVCLLIMIFVQDELSYDKYHEKHDRIYRVYLNGAIENKSAISASSCAPLAITLQNEIPEVEAATKIRNYGFPVFRYKDKVFSEEHVLYVDTSFFKVFTYKVVMGNKNNLLKNPNELIITEAMAKKYFGDENPIGKIINSDKRYDYEVVAVIEDVPNNSHFHFDFLASIERYEELHSNNWFGNNNYTYALLREGVDREEVQKKIDVMVLKFVKPLMEQIFGSTWSDIVKKGSKYNYNLQPLTDIHLRSNYESEIEPNSDITYIYIFAIIAFGILIIACVNFINLSTARYSGRAKEVGIRKTVGADFGTLVIQFLSESVILATIAVILSVLIVYALMPVFNEISGKELTFNLFSNITMIPLLLLFIIFIGVLAGLYPALFLASFIPIKVLSGKVKDSVKGKNFRGVLVVSQFAISIILIICTIIIYKQIDLLQNKKLGYQKERIIIIHKIDDIARNYKVFKTALERNKSVSAVSNVATLFGSPFGDNLYDSFVDGKKNSKLIKVMFADYDFINAFKIKMSSGRFYSKEWGADSLTSIVINQTAARELGFKNPIGQMFYESGMHSKKYIIIGVMEDFHYESLHYPIRPLIVRIFSSTGVGRDVVVRLNSDDYRTTVDEIRKTWATYAMGQNFEYTFFEDDYNRLYKSEERTGKLFASFSVLGIVIGCLGLFGLAAFTAEKRTKEIGIRKVLGASVKSIFYLLSKEFLRYLLIANLIAFPISYYLASIWLENFAFRIEIDVYIFLIATLVSVVIAFGSVSYTAIKVALINPVLSLKYE